MSIKEELDKYLDADGLIAPALGQGSNNGVLYMAEAIVILTKNLQDVPKEYIYALHRCVTRDGILQRHPGGGGGQQGPDDYIGFLVAMYHLINPYSTNGSWAVVDLMLHYAESNWWFMNNLNPGAKTLDSFMGRFPAVRALMYWAAGERPSLFVRLLVALTLAFSGKKGNTDSWVLAWMTAQVATKECWMSKLAYKLFTKRLLNTYPNGMKDVVTPYFEPLHPLAKYWPKV